MRKRWPLVLILLIIIPFAILIWQAPNMLRAIPSRYVARLPGPLQTLGAPQNVELLPTAPSNQDIESLLAETLPTATVAITRIPPSPSPPPTRDNSAATQQATPTPSPTTSPSPTATMEPIAAAHALNGVAHRIQTWNNCGPATLSMALSYFGLNHSQEQIAEVIKPDPEDRNVTPEEMADYVAANSDLLAISRTNGDLDTLRRLLSEDVPVIIEYGLQPENEYRWLEWMGHYLLVVAYDDSEGSVWVYDSWPRTGELPDETFVFEPIQISYTDLDRNWRAFNRNYIALYPDTKTALVEGIIGEDLADEIMWQNALRVVQAELEEEPRDAFLWFNLGTIYNAQGDYQRAAAAFDQARAIGLPWRMLWYQFGPYEAYYQMARYEDVILLADVTLKDRPYFEESYYYKAIAQLELGETDAARDNLQRAIDFNPNYQPARAALERLDLASN